MNKLTYALTGQDILSCLNNKCIIINYNDLSKYSTINSVFKNTWLASKKEFV